MLVTFAGTAHPFAVVVAPDIDFFRAYVFFLLGFIFTVFTVHTACHFSYLLPFIDFTYPMGYNFLCGCAFALYNYVISNNFFIFE